MSSKTDKYEELADKIVDLVGGKDNIEIFAHCVTRLRFNLKDKEKADIAGIEKIGTVIGVKWAGEQLQVIIGQGVAEAYLAVCEKHGLKQAGTKETGVNETASEKTGTDEKKKFSVMQVIEAITGCVIPLTPAFMGCAIVRTLAVALNMCGILSVESPTYIILNMVGEGGNYFIPILAAYTAAKRFGATEVMAMSLCSLLLAPTFVSNVTNEVPMSIFGLPIYAGDYSSMLFPAIFVVFVMSYVEKFFQKHIPKLLRMLLVPVCTMLIMVPLQFCLLAPAGLYIGSLITDAILFVYNQAGFIAVGLLGALFPLLVLTGMHTATVPAMITCYMQYGWDPIIIPAMTLSNFNQGIACFAVTLKSQNQDVKVMAGGAAVPAIVAGVTEPALFGVNFRYKTPLIAAVAGGFAGGCYLGIMNVGTYAAGGVGIMSVLGFISDNPNTLVHGLIGVAVSIVVTFVLTFILYKDQEI